jgi:hypothetical protein
MNMKKPQSKPRRVANTNNAPKKSMISGSWIKDHPVVVVIGVIGTIAAIFKAAPDVWEYVTRILDIPTCIAYADVYYITTGSFSKKDGNHWIETNNSGKFADFKETHRTREYIHLLNVTPREGNTHPMIIRIPACGGIISWTYENPIRWQDLTHTWKQ